MAPSNVYPTADGEEVLIAANRDTVFARLAETMGEPELATDERYATHDARGARQAELDGRVRAWTTTHSADELLAVLHAAGVPAGRVYQAKDMLGDPHFAAREAIVRLKHAALGEFPLQNVAPRLSDTPGAVRHLGPELGEHNDTVYRVLLGLDEKNIERLKLEGII